MADTAIGFEAPAIDDVAVGADPVEHAEAGGDEHGDGSATADEGGDQSTTAEDGKRFRAVENGKLAPKVAEALKELKAKDPQLARRIQSALFAEDRLFRELPQGFKEIATMRQAIENLGGDTGINELRAEMDGWREFDEQWTAGDPKVLEFLTGEPQAKDAFLKILPAAIDKYREFHPEGYNNYFAQVMAADMAQHEIQFTVRLLGDVLKRAQLSEPDKASAGELMTKLAGYMNRIADFAQKQVALPTSAGGANPNDARASELDTREQKLTREEWRRETDTQHSSIFRDAWDRLVKPALPVDKAKAQQAIALLRRLYPSILQEKLGAKKDFNPNSERFFQAKQKDGFLRLHGATFKEVVPLALRSAMAEAGIGRAAQAKSQGSNGQQRQEGQQRGGEVPQGFSRVAQKPDMTTVNRALTSPSMWSEKKAVLKNGKKVTWA